jgi:hypothetical protein
VGAELVEQPQMGPFVEELEVEIGEQRFVGDRRDEYRWAHGDVCVVDADVGRAEV